MSTNNTKPEGKEQGPRDLRLIAGKAANVIWHLTDIVHKVSFGAKESLVTVAYQNSLDYFKLLSDAMDEAQLSPSDHTAPQGEEEQVKLWKEAIDLIEVFADDVSKIHNDAIHVVANQFTIQKKQPLTKLSEGSDK